jgi:hypothetical protein
MNWKKQFEKLEHPYEGIYPDEGIEFIQTEIIEKLIADIPDAMYTNKENLPNALPKLKQQLRDKWINN